MKQLVVRCSPDIICTANFGCCVLLLPEAPTGGLLRCGQVIVAGSGGREEADERRDIAGYRQLGARYDGGIARLPVTSG